MAGPRRGGLRRGADRLALIFVLVVPLLAGQWGEVTLCPFAGLLGVPCPGCGLTRAGLHLLHGEVLAAIQLHPLVLIMVPGMAAAVIPLLVPSLRPQRLLDRRLVSTSVNLALAALLAVWLLRFAGWLGGPVAVKPWFRDVPSAVYGSQEAP